MSDDARRGRVLIGDCRDRLRDLDAESVQCVVTSPPYFGLRDYGVADQIGLEETPPEYVETMVGVMREVRRVLRADGTLWLNLGDSYAHGGCGARDAERWPKQSRNDHMPKHAKSRVGLPPKCLLGMPWRVALAMIDDGWILRSDIIWSKPSPMPESVVDRPTKAHEYLFLFAKQSRYFYDVDAIRTPQKTIGARHEGRSGWRDGSPTRGGISTRSLHPLGANRRDVWEIAGTRYEGAHFATFPPALVEPCILAGSRPGDTVLDTFAGSGTVAEVSLRLGRSAIAIELNPAYGALIEQRLAGLQYPLGGVA